MYYKLIIWLIVSLSGLLSNHVLSINTQHKRLILQNVLDIPNKVSTTSLADLKNELSELSNLADAISFGNSRFAVSTCQPDGLKNVVGFQPVESPDHVERKIQTNLVRSNTNSFNLLKGMNDAFTIIQTTGLRSNDENYFSLVVFFEHFMSIDDFQIFNRVSTNIEQVSNSSILYVYIGDNSAVLQFYKSIFAIKGRDIYDLSRFDDLKRTIRLGYNGIDSRVVFNRFL